MKRFLLALTALAFSLSASAAHADEFFDFTFTGTADLGGPLFSGSGIFDVKADGGNKYTIVGVTGEVGGVTISGLLPAGSFPKGFLENPNDNILTYPGTGIFNSDFFDSKGVSFSLANGSDVNLNDTVIENAVEGTKKDRGIFSLNTESDTICITPADPTAATPEPSSLMMLGTGVLSAAGLIRRRFVKA